MTRIHQSLLLVGTIILWAETIAAQGPSPTPTENTTTMIATTANLLSSTSITQTTESPAPTSATSTTKRTTSQATPTTTEATTANEATTTHGSQDGQSSKPERDNKESATKRIGSMAVAGLILVIVGLLLIAVNGYVFFKPKMSSCSTKSGIFHVLPMSSIKKKRHNGTDDESDVEDNFKEEDGITTVDTKDGPAEEAPGQNGQVQTKADVIAKPSTDITGPTKEIAGPSTDIAGPSTVIEVGEEAAENANADHVVDESKTTEEEVQKSKETVVTVEGDVDQQP